VSNESKDSLSSGEEPSGMTGCTSRYLIDSIRRNGASATMMVEEAKCTDSGTWQGLLQPSLL
jgi:hypothetical protein